MTEPTEKAATPQAETLAEIEAAAAASENAKATEKTITPETAPQPEPEPAPAIPDAAFDATHEMIVSGIKMALKKYPGGEQAGEVWESPFFKQAVVPVLRKYNLTIYNLPVELVLIGAIITLAKQTADIIREARDAEPAS